MHLLQLKYINKIKNALILYIYLYIFSFYLQKKKLFDLDLYYISN